MNARLFRAERFKQAKVQKSADANNEMLQKFSFALDAW